MVLASWLKDCDATMNAVLRVDIGLFKTACGGRWRIYWHDMGGGGLSGYSHGMGRGSEPVSGINCGSKSSGVVLSDNISGVHNNHAGIALRFRGTRG